MAARLYAEAVALFTAGSVTMSRHEYNRLREAAENAQRRAEAVGMAFEEHVGSHWRDAKLPSPNR